MTVNDQRNGERGLARTGAGRAGHRIVVVGVLVGAASMIGVGAWCRFDPVGFAAWANWPVHEHFLHDAGVFQIAIGMMMIAALVWRDVVAVALAGFVFTNVAHAYNHDQDRAAGGHASDPVYLLGFAVLGGGALLVHVRRRPAARDGGR